MKKWLAWAAALMLLAAVCCPGLSEDSDWQFASYASEIRDYSGPAGSVTVPAQIGGEAVLKVRCSAFVGRDDITSVTFSEGIRVLGVNTLNNMANLESVSLPQSLRIIDSGSLFSCDSLTEVTIPAGVRLIGSNFLGWCGKLARVTFEGVCPHFTMPDFAFSVLPDSVVVYVPDDQVDAYRAALPNLEDSQIRPSGRNAVIVPDETKEADFVFDAATGTVNGYLGREERVVIPASIGGVPVKRIGESAFSQCGAYVISVPEGVEEIGRGAFSGRLNLNYVELPDSVRVIGDEAFQYYQGYSIHIPASLERIGERAFVSSYLTGELTLPEGLTEIGDSAFESSPIREAYFPASLVSIGSRAFAGRSLYYLYFEGKTLPKIARDAFDGQKLEDVDINWKATKDSMLSAQAFFDSIGQTARVWRMQNPNVDYTWDDLSNYKNGLMTGYTGSMTHIRPWDTCDGIDTVGIADGALKGNQVVKYFSVCYNDVFVTIGAEAFADSAVEYVDLFDSVETIGAGAFRNSRLTEITLPASLRSIGSGAFKDCAQLKTVTVLCNPGIIPKDAFEGCSAVETVRTADNDGRDSVALAASLGLNIPSLKPTPVPTVAPTPAPALPSGEDYAVFGGTWYLTEIVLEGTAFNPADLGMSMVLTLNADGTVTGENTGDAMEGTWSASGGEVGVTIEGDEMLFRYEDGVLIGDGGGFVMTFSQEGPKAGFAPAEAIAAASPADFGGTWAAVMLSMDGQYYPVSALENEEWRIIFGSEDRTLQITGTTAIPFGGEEENFSFSGGRLENLSKRVEGVDPSLFDKILELHADGTLSYQVLGMTIYFERVGGSPAPAPAAGVDSDAFGGTWYMTEMIMGGASYNPSDFGYSVFFTLNGDGTVTGESMGEAEEGTWTSSGNEVRVTLSGAEMPFVYEDGLLKGDAGSYIMIFSREAPGAGFAPAAAIPAPSVNDFNGTWTAVTLGMEGQYMPVSVMGSEYWSLLFGAEDYTIRISGGTVTAFGGEPEAYAFSNGRLEKLSAPMEGIDPALLDKILLLHADGTLSFQIMGMTLYCERAEGGPVPAAGYGVETEAKYVCAGAEVDGVPVDPALLGEYSVIFHGDGSVTFVMAGVEMPDLRWVSDGSGAVIDYFGTAEMRFVPADGGLTLNYFDTLLLTFTK